MRVDGAEVYDHWPAQTLGRHAAFFLVVGVALLVWIIVDVLRKVHL